LPTHLEKDVSVGFELPEAARVLKVPEGRVEEVGGEGCYDTAEEDLPGQRDRPERRHLLHGEQQAADRGTERRRHTCRGTR